MVETLSTNPNVATRFQDQFRYILIDEFQDTNHLQYQLIKCIAGQKNYISVVGDDDQSIYSWRGARVDHILSFANDYPDVTTIRLEQNYRSTGHILAAANTVIANNSNRLGKTLWTKSDPGEKITVFNGLNEQEEARYCVDHIMSNHRTGAEYQQHAILYRSNAQSRVLEEHLTRAGISYRIYGGLRFFERAEIKDSLAYLRLIINPHDDQHLSALSTSQHAQLAKPLTNSAYWPANIMYHMASHYYGRTRPTTTGTQNTKPLETFAEMIQDLSEKCQHLKASELAELCIKHLTNPVTRKTTSRKCKDQA